MKAHYAGNFFLNVSHSYDQVGNITGIQNTAGSKDNLGGAFSGQYSYNPLCRLASAMGSSGSSHNEREMTYTLSGNIYSKTVMGQLTDMQHGSFPVDYNHDYSYNGSAPHQVAGIVDQNSGSSFNSKWDLNDSTTLHAEMIQGFTKQRYLYWDEENRLSATRDQYYATANIYDASGNRAWKLGGELNWMWNNGQGWQAYGDLNLRTWYQSDLVTITDQAMTKHYFIAGQRIASKLAESLEPEVVQSLKDKPVTPLSGDIRDLAEATATRLKRDFDCLGIDYNAFYPGETRLQALEILQSAPEVNEYQVFFYHSDHLGSSSFITDVNGDATQHLQYLPFGEDLVHEQNTAAYLSPYTFSGKERDVETNLSYFGARYYEAGLSVWLSVDPMSDKYPSLSAYNYCALNPVMLVDPDGREIVLTGENKNQAFTQLQSSTKLKLKMNEDGLISASGKAKTPGDKLLLKAINDKNIKVTVYTDRSSIDLPDRENMSVPFDGGGFGGNQTAKETITDQLLSSVKPYTNQNISSERRVTNAQQFVNPDELMALDIIGGANLGTSMKHEVTEAYLGGTYGHSSGRNILPACENCGFQYAQQYAQYYVPAHNNATFQPAYNSKSELRQLGQTIGLLKQFKFY